ncbi:MAG: hypothetical protein ABI895_15465 [Deltaproteobacteria bacterium]
MDDMHAQGLQEQAIEALAQLRAWIWTQHATLLPDDVSTITREQAARYAAHLDWYTTVDTALQALERAAPSFSEPCAAAEEPAELAAELPAAAPAPPTARVTPDARLTARSGVWHRTIAVSAPASQDRVSRPSVSQPCISQRSVSQRSVSRRSVSQQSAA